MTLGYHNYAHEPSWIYRIYDDRGVLLYVGLSRNARERIGVHAKEKSWGGDIDHYTIERFPDRETALEAERVAIADELPLHNVVRSDPMSRDRSRDSHVTNGVTVTAQSRGCHAAVTRPTPHPTSLSLWLRSFVVSVAYTKTKVTVTYGGLDLVICDE